MLFRSGMCIIVALVFCCSLAAAANPWESAIVGFEQADKAKMPAEDGILFTGSSTISIWNKALPRDMAPFPAFGRGFGGSMISDIVYYVDRVVIPYKPRAVLVYSGSNDIVGGKSPAQVADDFKELARLVHARLPKTYVVFVSQPAVPSREGWLRQMEEMNALIHEFALATPMVGYFEIRPVLLGENGRCREEFYTSDMLHMNPNGYALLNGALKTQLLDLLYGTLGPTPRQQAVNRYTTRIHFSDAIMRGGSSNLQIPIVNDTEFPLTFSGEWKIPGEKYSTITPRVIKPVTIAPGKSATISCVANIATACMNLPVLNWTITSGDARVRGAALVALAAGARYAVGSKIPAQAMLKIDREENVNISTRGKWQGAKDCSATGWLKKGKDAFTVHVDVTDDVLQGEKGNPWDKDAVEIYFDLRPADKRGQANNDPGRFQLIAVPGFGSTTPDVVHQYIPSKDNIEGVTMKSAKTESGYWVEVTIPLAGLQPKHGLPTTQFLFDLAIDDSDTPGALKTQLRAAGSIASFNTPQLWMIMRGEGK